jgi:hypothetical protein
VAKIFGGSASRLEVYALFAAAVVLIGGSIGGAIVVTSSDSKPAEVAQVSADTTVVDTTVEPVAVEVPVASEPRSQNTTRPTEAPRVSPPIPTTTICIPDQSQLSQLESNRITDAARFTAEAISNNFESFVPAFGIEINRIRKANIAEWQRALAALQSCQATSWNFERYPNRENYRTPTTTWR